MKKLFLLTSVAFALLVNVSFAEEVRDWHDLQKVHEKIQGALKDMERAQKANHYDMGGHAAKAEEALRQAEHELHEAIESVKHDKH